MTADELRADLIAKALRAIGERYGHNTDDGPPGVEEILQRLCREWERAPCDATTAEIPIYPPAGWEDEPTKPS